MNTTQKKYYTVILIILFLLFYDEPYTENEYQNIRPVENPHSLCALVNKNYQLPWDFIPAPLAILHIKYANDSKYLILEARNAFEQLSEDASTLGYYIVAVSAYRSYDYQLGLYTDYVATKGQEYADHCCARPGHSEHQTGLALDVMGSNLDYNQFEEAVEFPWMKQNAHKYGFILRYPKGKEHITGFKYEPWHYRYVGKKVAKEIYQENITLEEYLASKK